MSGVGCGGEAGASRRASAFIVEAVSGGRARDPLGSLAVTATGGGRVRLTAGFVAFKVLSTDTRARGASDVIGCGGVFLEFLRLLRGPRLPVAVASQHRQL